MPYYKTEIKAGRTVEVIKSYTRRIDKFKHREDKDKPTPEEMEKVNQKNAEAKLRRLINANFGLGDYHLVLTYKREDRPDPAEAKKRFANFIRKLRREYKKLGVDLKYIIATEYKPIHHHIILNGIDANILKVLRQCWPYGTPHLTPLDDTGQYSKLAEYLIKETSKTFRDNDGGTKQRYSHSRNLIVPKPKITRVEASRWLEDPKPVKGYYIDKDSVHNYINPFTGKKMQQYTMVMLPDDTG